MNIKILHSWLKEYLKTDATPKQIAERLSLTSVSIERVKKWENDYVYDIEMMTSRPDLMSVIGIAREAGAVLPQSGITATFLPPRLNKPTTETVSEKLTIKNDPQLVNRICAVIMEVSQKPSPKVMQDRLESSDIRSLTNLVDVTNYVMRAVGHPTHVFDYDRLATNTLIIRASKKGEKVTTLDGKTYTLPGGDIVADDGKGKIVDLLGIMGLENTVVTKDTKRILFFIDNNSTTHIRDTSMQLGIRTDAAQINEKGIDPESAMDALLFGIELYKKYADAKILSHIIDIYPKKTNAKQVTVSFEQIDNVIGISIPKKTVVTILEKLGFLTTATESNITVTVPSFRMHDVSIPEDLIEEIARVYGYDKIPSIVPPIQPSDVTPFDDNEFYWEQRIRYALKFWGFTECYTYPMVSETMYEGRSDEGVRLANPLGEEFVFMRQSLVPSLLKVLSENKRYEKLRLFEIAHVYRANKNDLPQHITHLAGVIKEEHATFFTVKGIIEQLLCDLNISSVTFHQREHGGVSSEIRVGNTDVGTIEVLDRGLINFELDLRLILNHATTNILYRPLSKFPPIIEDLAFEIPSHIATGDIIQTIKKIDRIISHVSLLDRYKDTRTFHILYQDQTKNLTGEEAIKIREKIEAVLKDKYNAHFKK